MNSMHLDQLIQQREVAKRNEEVAVAARRAIDDQIVEVVGTTDEGTINQVINNKRIVVTFEMKRTVSDAAELERLWPAMPPNVRACFRPVPPAVAVRNYKDLATTDPISFGILAKIISAKPQRPSIKIEDFDPNQD